MPTFERSYLLDADVLGHIQDHPDSDHIYAGIAIGIATGRVKTVRQVYGELKRFPKAYAAMLPLKSTFEIEATKQLSLEVSEMIEFITNTVGDLFEQLGGKNPDPADPWLIAVAKVHGFDLVTDERPFSPKKIPQVCDLDGIKVRCISGPHFLVETGIVTEIRPEHISIHAFYGLGNRG